MWRSQQVGRKIGAAQYIGAAFLAVILITFSVFQTYQQVDAGTTSWGGNAEATVISGGDSHSCAVTDGLASCWGLGSSGQLGNNATSSSDVPVAVNTAGVLGGKTVTAISVGTAHSCAVADGAAFCWGAGTDGRLGNNSTSQSNVPVAVNTAGVLSGKTVTAIAAGDVHSCAVADGAAFCWGANGGGILGNSSTTQSNVPVAVNTAGVLAGKNVTGISTGNAHTCVVADGAAYCWGLGGSGRLGHNSVGGSIVAVAVNTAGVLGGKTVTAISAGTTHTCAVASGEAFCWGVATSGRLGHNDDTGSSSVPVAVYTSGVLGGKNITAISAGSAHSCAVASGEAFCWGLGGNGRLGNNNNIQSNVPVAVNTAGILSGKAVTAISAGVSHSCAVASSQAYCWGLGTDGRLGYDDTTESFVPVAVQSLTTPLNASSYRWYDNANSATPGAPLAGIDSVPKLSSPGDTFRLRQGIDNGTGFTAISAGNAHTCGIADGTAYCWGAGADGRLGNGSTSDSSIPVAVNTTGVLSGKTVIAISTGTSHTCAIASDNLAYCWGAGSSGQLGNGSITQQDTPVAVSLGAMPGGSTIKQISAGATHTCAIASNNLAYCWGNAGNGRLGNGATTPNQSSPVAVSQGAMPGGATIRQISAGVSHTCAIASNDLAYCWGLGTSGELGNGGITQQTTPVAVSQGAMPVGATILQITAGGIHNCAIASDHKAYCWGSASNGRLGNSAITPNQSTPVAVSLGAMPSGTTISRVVASTSHTCATTADYKAYCWGGGANGRRGDGSTSATQTTPVAVSQGALPTGATIQQISTSFGHTCVIDSSKQVYCWGGGTNGQRGDSATTADQTTPVAISTAGVMSDKTVTAISAGVSHSCAVADGAAYCWGLGTSGQLGNNAAISSSVPVAVNTAGVLSGKTVTAVSVGSAHSCAIADDEAFCWGAGTSGRLGNNSTSQSNVPVAVNTAGVLSGRTVTSIGAGTAHSCAVADNLAFCWGLNTNGQLGNNSTTQSNVPVAVNVAGVLSGKTMTAISAGDAHSCAIGSAAAYCWGVGTSGRLGHNATTQSTVPVAVNTAGVLSGKTVTAISAGISHSCAVASAEAFCWGVGTSGRLGNNGTTSSSVPVAVNTAGVLGGKTVTGISAGSAHSCAVAGNAGYCWGLGGNGRLGNNNNTQSNVPVAADTAGELNGKATTYITAGTSHTCSIADGAVFCWGYNLDGRLGNNSVIDSFTAVSVYTKSPLAFLGSIILANANSYVLQYAALSAATCSAQTSGFAAVTISTPIAYSTNPGVANGAAITTNSTDPTGTSMTVPQTYRSSDGAFTNTSDIPPGYTGLFDFSLIDNGATANATYCIRIAYDSGSAIESASAYAEITMANGVLIIEIVDGSDNIVAAPSFPMSTTVVSTACQPVTGIFGTSSQQMRVYNTLSLTGWSMNVAATAGPTGSWGSVSSSYDFNDPSGSPSGCNSGSDGDGIAGRLTLDPSVSTLTPESGCATTGLSKGGIAGFSQGVIDAITLLAASSSTPTSCYYHTTDVDMLQYIPANQPAGSYGINLTITVVAQ